MLEIKDLCKRYADKQALDHVSLTVGPGEIVGLFGENGAGKTTLMKCILSLIRYDSGSVTLDGAAITRANIGRFSFATCEHSFFPALSAQAHREFYEEHFDTFLSRRFEGLMEFFGLPMDKPIRSFSTGQKNQFEVIMALSQGADYILMDEPFAGNDVFNREDFYKVLLGILEPHETVILSTHLIEEVTGFIGRAVLLHEGKIVGDAQTAALDEQGLTLMEYVKQTFSYQSDRVSKALAELTGREDDDAYDSDRISRAGAGMRVRRGGLHARGGRAARGRDVRRACLRRGPGGRRRAADTAAGRAAAESVLGQHGALLRPGLYRGYRVPLLPCRCFAGTAAAGFRRGGRHARQRLDQQ